MENLELERNNIMRNLENIKNGDITAIRKNEASRWIGSNILGNNSNDFRKLKMSDSVKKRIATSEARLNKLREEKSKIVKEAFPYIDELDILQKQYEDKDFNYKALKLANDLKGKDIDPLMKANQLEFMRKRIEDRAGHNDNSFLNDSIKHNNNHRMPGSRNRVRSVKDLPNQMAVAKPGILPPIVGVPPVAGVPPPVPGSFGLPGVPGFFGHPFGPHTLANPMAGFTNPNLAFMKSQIEKQEEENKRIEDELLNNSKSC